MLKRPSQKSHKQTQCPFSSGVGRTTGMQFAQLSTNFCMLTESLIIRKPNATVEVTMSVHDQELVQGWILPATGEERCKHQRKNGRGLNPHSNVLNSTTLTFCGCCQYGTTIQQKLRLLFRSVEIGSQQLREINVLACYDLVHQLSGNW